MAGGREYPERPVVGVGGVVVRAGRVLIVQRASEPLAGQWSLPGGGVETGETLEEAVKREMQEEIGLAVTVLELVEAFERIVRDADGRVRYHYVLLDYLCEADGEPCAGSDVQAVAWAGPEDFARYGLLEKATQVCHRALELRRRRRAQ